MTGTSRLCLRDKLTLRIYCFHTVSLQYMVREHMVEEGMTHHLKSAGHSIIRKLSSLLFMLLKFYSTTLLPKKLRSLIITFSCFVYSLEMLSFCVPLHATLALTLPSHCRFSRRAGRDAQTALELAERRRVRGRPALQGTVCASIAFVCLQYARKQF